MEMMMQRNENDIDNSELSYAVMGAFPIMELMMDEDLNKDFFILMASETGDILATKPYGDVKEWEYPYDEIAKKELESILRKGQSEKIVKKIITAKTTDLDNVPFIWSWKNDSTKNIDDDKIYIVCSGQIPNNKDVFSPTVKNSIAQTIFSIIHK